MKMRQYSQFMYTAEGGSILLENSQRSTNGTGYNGYITLHDIILANMLTGRSLECSKQMNTSLALGQICLSSMAAVTKRRLSRQQGTSRLPSL